MKKYNKIIISLIVFSFVLSPILIFAQGKGSGKGSGNACEAITKIQNRITEGLTKREGQLNNKEESIGNKYQERKQEREMALEQRREKWDENREEHFAKLTGKAVNDEQKQAVLEFVEVITNAVKDRREAFDQAILGFQEGLNDIHQGRSSSLAEVVASYKEAVNQAFEQAEQSCGDGTDIKTARNNLRDALKNVRDQYREDVRGFQSHGEDIQELIEIKKEAMNNAKDEFKEILDQSLENLKVSFPEIEEEEEE